MAEVTVDWNSILLTVIVGIAIRALWLAVEPVMARFWEHLLAFLCDTYRGFRLQFALGCTMARGVIADLFRVERPDHRGTEIHDTSGTAPRVSRESAICDEFELAFGAADVLSEFLTKERHDASYDQRHEYEQLRADLEKLFARAEADGNRPAMLWCRLYGGIMTAGVLWFSASRSNRRGLIADAKSKLIAAVALATGEPMPEDWRRVGEILDAVIKRLRKGDDSTDDDPTTDPGGKRRRMRYQIERVVDARNLLGEIIEDLPSIPAGRFSFEPQMLVQIQGQIRQLREQVKELLIGCVGSGKTSFVRSFHAKLLRDKAVACNLRVFENIYRPAPRGFRCSAANCVSGKDETMCAVLPDPERSNYWMSIRHVDHGKTSLNVLCHEIRIRMEAYDHCIPISWTGDNVDHAEWATGKDCGSVLLLRRMKQYAVLRSLLVDRKCLGRFDISTQNRRLKEGVSDVLAGCVFTITPEFIDGISMVHSGTTFHRGLVTEDMLGDRRFESGYKCRPTNDPMFSAMTIVSIMAWINAAGMIARRESQRRRLLGKTPRKRHLKRRETEKNEASWKNLRRKKVLIGLDENSSMKP